MSFMLLPRSFVSPYELTKVTDTRNINIVNFAAGGVATPADAAIMVQLGMDRVFVGSGMFKSENPAACTTVIVRATKHYKDPKVLMEGSPVSFRNHDGGEYSYEGCVPPKKQLHKATETQMHGSSWERN
eukprot:5462489-Ditylum_brightwellii.AAC.1